MSNNMKVNSLLHVYFLKIISLLKMYLNICISNLLK